MQRVVVTDYTPQHGRWHIVRRMFRDKGENWSPYTRGIDPFYPKHTGAPADPTFYNMSIGAAQVAVDCPMCGSHTSSARNKLAVLSERLKEVEAEAGVDMEVPAAFDRESQRVTTEVSATTERLRSVQIRKRALSGRSKEASERQFAAKKAERFVGIAGAAGMSAPAVWAKTQKQASWGRKRWELARNLTLVSPCEHSRINSRIGRGYADHS